MLVVLGEYERYVIYCCEIHCQGIY